MAERRLEWRQDFGEGKSPEEVYGEIRRPKPQSVGDFFRNMWLDMTPEEKTVEAMSWLLPPAKGGGLLAKAGSIGMPAAVGMLREVGIKNLVRGLGEIPTEAAYKQAVKMLRGFRVLPKRALEAVEDIRFANFGEMPKGTYGSFRPRNNTIKLNPYYAVVGKSNRAARSATHEVTHTEWWNPRAGADISQINLGRLLGRRLDDMVEDDYIKPWLAYKLRPSELAARKMGSLFREYSSQGEEIPQKLWDEVLKKTTSESSRPAEEFLYRSGDELGIRAARRLVEELGSTLLK